MLWLLVLSGMCSTHYVLPLYALNGMPDLGGRKANENSKTRKQDLASVQVQSSADEPKVRCGPNAR